VCVCVCVHQVKIFVIIKLQSEEIRWNSTLVFDY